MRTTKSFNSSLENIVGRIFIVPKILIFGANESCRNYKNLRVCASLATDLFLALSLVTPPEGHQLLSPDTTDH